MHGDSAAVAAAADSQVRPRSEVGHLQQPFRIVLTLRGTNHKLQNYLLHFNSHLHCFVLVSFFDIYYLPSC